MAQMIGLISCLPGMLAIYTNQLEVGLRIPTSTFFRISVRYWATRVTQQTPNAIRVLVSFELICYLLDIHTSINLFRCFYTIKKHINDWGWFCFSLRHGSTKFIDAMPTSIKHWKERFIFVSEKDFSGGFWWRLINALNDSIPGTLELGNFAKLRVGEIP